jgi:DedD protein
MAFFKFRMPAQTASTEAAAPGPNENLEVVRRRARHRLMGAVVLVLVAVVGFPLLFDTQPRPVAVDTPIVIPDRQSTPPLASAVPVPKRRRLPSLCCLCLRLKRCLPKPAWILAKRWSHQQPR